MEGQDLESSQNMEQENLVTNGEETVVIEESQGSTVDVADNDNENVETSVYQPEVCNTRMTVAEPDLTGSHDSSETIPQPIQNAVVDVNPPAIVASQEVQL